MSAGLIRSDFNALRNANELAAHDSIAQLAGVKRGLDSGDDYPAKKSNSGNGNMDGTLGMSMGMPITIAGAGMGAPAPFTMGQPMGANMNENVVEVISVPDNTVGLVIGRGGEQISAIQSQSGARVQMSPDSEGTGQRQCTIQGMKAAVERAKQLIFEVINRAGNRPPPNQTTQLTSGPGQITVELLIPANKCGLVIGKQGDTIRQLQEQSGAKMMMIQDTQEVTGTAKPLRIVGEPDKVENAKRLIENIIAGGPEGMASSRLYGQQEATARGEVVVPRASVGMIIGKGGETIKRLGLETGTKIQFKPDDDPSAVERTAVITGSREQIFKATEMITELVQKALAGGGSNDTFYMHVPANKTGLVIGKGGETIKQINAESGAHCELSRDPPPNANEKVFIIKGTPYQIHHAQHIIRIKVGDVPPGTPVPPFSGPGGPTMMQPQMGFQQNPGFNGVAQFGQPIPANNQWTQPQPAANGWQQPQQAAYYDPSQQAQAAQPQQATYGGMAAAANPYGQQQFGAPGVGQPAAAQPAAQPVQAQPTINPATGQPDYSAQWAEYYRQMGMHDQAAAIENQLKQTQAARGAVPQQAAQPQFGGYQQGAAGVPASGATTMPTFAASQPQQYPYSQPY